MSGTVTAKAPDASSCVITKSTSSSDTTALYSKTQDKPQPIYAERGKARVQSLRMVWPIVCRRLEGLPNISAIQIFEELCIQFPGRFTRRQYPTLLRRVNRWRKDARARGVIIGARTYRLDKPRGRRPDIFRQHWEEMVQSLEEHPD